ncbi:hypothetical protein C2I18_21130 [Paenibacillus sp. PK3_47]|uniref:DUF4435 domain-containing protein n=1 Tax=Paenibacillus sp. PK3_47 TaxID=2072642 RepID=UPI00201E269E|nr:DUF4435 domain-containing protein [Paenibacillus sp. PK3_47]UQZ35810.1 hypothetical protein C2I18_21130 [Paenibacillus sp. PK3_47]
MKLNEMREQRYTAPVKYTEFTRTFKKSKTALFCFVEGEDSKFYNAHVRNYFVGSEIIFFKSGGKDEVLRLFRLINTKSEYSEVKSLYFVDRDFDDSLNIPQIYETPCYSIENLYTTSEALCRILTSEFGIEYYEDEYEVISDLYFERQIEFHEAALYLNAWIICQKKLISQGKQSRLLLNKLKFNEYFDVSLTKVNSKYDISTIKNTFSEASDINEQDILSEVEQLKNTNLQKSLRGKFELEFLRTFLDKLKTLRCEGNNSFFNKKRKVSITLSRDNLISELAQYAEVPPCLIHYLSHYSEVYKEEQVGA